MSYDASYAAYLDRATNTWFEENKIFNGQAGAYVYNTGSNGGTRFYRNNFGRDGDYVNYTPRGMDAATVVVGSNSNWDINSPPIISTGLQVRCNDYMANDFAISVFNGNMRKTQGTVDGETNQLAGNQFHSTIVNGIEFNVNIEVEEESIDDYSEYSIGVDYEYYQHNDAISVDQEYNRELTYFSEDVTPYTQSIRAFSLNNSCPSNFGLPRFDHATAISNISVRKSTLENLQKQYDKVVDKGDTWYMKSVAKLMNNENYAEAYEILQNEGYLTDTVLIALLCNEIAPSNAIAAILLENSPLPEKVVKLIEDMPLSSNIKNWLSFYSSGLNSRIELEYQMADINQEIFDIESELINNAVNDDSTTTVIDATLNYYIQKSNKDFNDYISIYKLNLSNDNLLNAQSSLIQLRTYAAQQPPEIATELLTFCDVNEIYLDYISEEHGDTAILARNKEMLFSAARSSSALYSATAEILYSYITDSSFYEYTPMPFEVMTPRNIEATTEEPVLFKPQIKVYPNPSDGLVFVEYNFAESYTEGYELIYRALGIEQKDNCEHGEIRVYTYDAKLLQTVQLNALSGMITIDIRSYTPGTYLLEIADCFGNTETVKITKTY